MSFLIGPPPDPPKLFLWNSGKRFPPDPADPRRPSDISDLDSKRVIVLAKHLANGVARIAHWGDRTTFYNDELALSTLEEVSLERVLPPAAALAGHFVDPQAVGDVA